MTEVNNIQAGNTQKVNLLVLSILIDNVGPYYQGTFTASIYVLQKLF